MKSEIYRAGKEMHQPESLKSTKEQLFTSAPEIVPPPSEYPPLPDEFACANAENSDASQESREQKKKQEEKQERKLHKKLTRLMGYAVASVLAVIILSSTLHTEEIKDNVINAGGSVDGDLRFTIQWNDVEENLNDFDAHCREPNGWEIFYGNREENSPCGGDLDVDIINPTEEVAVENIIYPKKSQMEDGEYILSVVCYNNIGYDGGFRAQIELRGRIYNFEYNEPMETGDEVVVAIVTVKNGRMTIDPQIGSKLFW